MILQSLNQLYDRLATDPGYAIAPAGYSLQKIAFTVVLHPDGRLHDIIDARDHDGKKPLPVLRLLPGQAKPPGSAINPCFLWDNSAYMLGYVSPQQSKESDEKYQHRAERTARSFAAFRERHLAVEAQIDAPVFAAVCRFLERWQPEQAEKYTILSDITTGFGVFQQIGEARYIHEHPAVKTWWARQQLVNDPTASHSICLVSGRRAPAALIHEPAIKGVRGAQSSGAKIVSFNCDAFTSYGKEQSENSPVSEEATFRYCTALNGLLSGPRSSRHRFSLGDTTIAFWTGKPTIAEGWLSAMFAGDLQIDDVRTPPCSGRSRCYLRRSVAAVVSCGRWAMIRPRLSICWGSLPTPHACRYASGIPIRSGIYLIA